jgi:hypothetical protein
VNGTTGGARAAARRLVACALLLAVLVMHGNPATAGDGCQAPAGLVTVPMNHSVAVPVRAAHRAALEVPGMRGATCVATQVRAGLRLAAPALAVLFSIAALLPVVIGVGRVPGLRAWGRRAPPGGRAVLLRACVART